MEHGRKNQIEGELKPNSKVILIEDLISTGKSSINAIQALENGGSKVIALMSIFTYGFFNTNTIHTPCFSLCDYATLIESAINKKMITENERELLLDWQKNIQLGQ